MLPVFLPSPKGGAGPVFLPLPARREERLDRIMAGLSLDRDPAQLGETVDAGLAAEAAVAGGFGAAEGHLRLVMNGRAVDMADAGLDLARNAQAPGSVLRKD